MTVLSLAILLGGTDVGSEPLTKQGIAFGLPLKCTAEKYKGPSAVDSTDNCQGRCLADSFKPGLSVVLLRRTGTCKAKTGHTCTFSLSYGPEEMTRLVGTHQCLAVRDKETLFGRNSFQIAVVGVDPAIIRMVPQSDDQSPLPKDAISWARQLLEASEPSNPVPGMQRPPYRVRGRPHVIRVKNVVLLKFEFTRESHGHERALLLLVNNRLFRLNQYGCPGEYVFFTIDGKLHVTFWDSACGAGIVDKVVYDLSSDTPKLVYANGVVSD